MKFMVKAIFRADWLSGGCTSPYLIFAGNGGVIPDFGSSSNGQSNE